MARILGFRPACLLGFVREPAAAQRDPKTPSGGKPESAAGRVSSGAGPDSWPGGQEEDQQDRDSSSSGQLQGERPPRAMTFIDNPAWDWLTSATLLSPLGDAGRRERGREGRKGTSPPSLDQKMRSCTFFTLCLDPSSLHAEPPVTAIPSSLYQI